MDDLSHLPQQYAPLVFAARNGFGLFVIVQDKRTECPIPVKGTGTTVVIGDDLDRSKGLAAFETGSLRRFLWNCSTVLIMAGAADEKLYAAAAMKVARGVAESTPRPNAVIIETRPDHEGEWLDFVTSCVHKATTFVLLSTPVAGSA
jgi:hypothetical protein